MKNSTLRVYNTDIFGEICMAGYTLSRNNPLTMHHITPLRDGGKTDFDNSSIISYLGHAAIHKLDYDYRKKDYIQEYLHYYKETQDEKARMDFYRWITDEMAYMGYQPTLSSSKLLIYVRRND